MVCIIYRNLKIILPELTYLLKKGKFRDFYNRIVVSFFSRESGIAILDPIYRRFPKLIPFPQFVEIEPTTHCNLKCTMCENTHWNEKPRHMSFEEFKKIVDQFPKLKWVGVTGIGSSFLNKDFIKMIEYLKSRHVFVELFDTFYHIDAAVSERLVDLGVDMIIMSLDGATKETYEAIRVNSDFDKVTKNVKDLIRIKKEKGSPLPRLSFHYIISAINIEEVPSFIELAHSFGNKEGTTVQFTALLHEFDEIKSLMKEIPSEIKNEANSKAEKLGVRLFWNETIDRSKHISNCVRWTEPFIQVDGTIQSCCVINEANQRDLIRKYAFGNVLKGDMKKIWNSERYINFRKEIRDGNASELCKTCSLYFH